MRAPLLRPEFGPSLPQILSRRLSVSVRVITLAAIALLVVAVVVTKVILDSGRAHLVVHGSPTFNLVYDPSLLRRVTPHAGELIRLQAARRHVAVSITAAHANLPAGRGDVLLAQLPVYATQYMQRVAARLPKVAVTDEGKARFGTVMGYQVGYVSTSPHARTYGRDIFFVPGSGRADQTVLLSLRQTFSGPTGPRDQALVQAAKKAFHSFRFGTSQPLLAGG